MEPVQYPENRDDNLLCQEFMIKRSVSLVIAKVEYPHYPSSDNSRDLSDPVQSKDGSGKNPLKRRNTTDLTGCPPMR